MATATKTKTVHLLKGQDAFVFSSAKYAAYVGGLGSGKTWAGCIKAVLKAQSPGVGLMLAPTYPMMRDVTQKTLFALLNEALIPYEHHKTEERIVFDTGGIILCRSSDQPERLRGLNLNWAYLDEAAQMSESMWKVILGRLRIGDSPSAWITTTPSGYNWVYRRWVEDRNDNYQLIHASTTENTYLPAEYLDDLRANYTGDFARQEIDGDFVAFEGMVYPEFSRAVNAIPSFEVPAHWQRVRAIDYGYTNPFVCLWGAVDEDGRLYIYDEHYRAKTLMDDHAAAIKRRAGAFAWTVADHDAQDNAELISRGIYTTNANKEVIRGIQKVKARCVVQADGQPRLYVMDRCVNLIREFGLYHYQDSVDERNDKEEPLKSDDHAMDALRYMVMQMDSGRFYLV